MKKTSLVEVLGTFGYKDELTLKGAITRAKKTILGLGVSTKLTEEQKELDEFEETAIKDFLIATASGKSVYKEKAKELLISDFEMTVDEFDEVRKEKNRSVEAIKRESLKKIEDERDEFKVSSNYWKNRCETAEAELKTLKTEKRTAKMLATKKANAEKKEEMKA